MVTSLVEGVVGGSFGLLAVLFLGFVGFAASLATFIEFNRASGSPLCRPGSKIDCLRVYSMPQAWVMGFHLSQLAPIFYSFMLALEVIALVFNSVAALRLIAILSLGASLLAPYMIYLMVRYARAVCIYCLLMHASTILIAILTYRAALEALALTT